MHFSVSSRFIIVRLVSILLTSYMLGYVFGYAQQAFLLTCVSLLVWHHRHMLQLINWLWKSKTISPPQWQGLWGHISDGFYQQIRQQRQKHKELNDRVRRFRDGAEALPDAALVLASDLTIQWGNKKSLNLLGIKWPDDLGQRVDNLLRDPVFFDYLQLGLFDQPCIFASPLNPDIQLELRLMDYGREHTLLLARDISPIHRLEQMRRDFVANVSHELKTPLTVVRGYVEMVQASDNCLDPHWLKAFATIESQVTRMDRLVEQLLVLSRVEMNLDVAQKKVQDVPQIIETLVADAVWLNQEKQHKINTMLDNSIGVLGLDTELKSAFANLLYNAISYTPAKGQIDLYWQREGDRVKFMVKDNGPGIRPEHINRLTERFYRVDQSRSRNTGGSGLGLAIVKHVLQHHNAKLEINSRWGQGSEFSIYFDAHAITPLSEDNLISS
jgi:two-component system phosphate regulon sensor histidine kinase PhoR